MYTVQQATIFNERLYAKINDEWYIIGTGVKHVECFEDEMRVFTEFKTIAANISYKISFEEYKGIRIITSFIGMTLGEAPLKLSTIIETSEMVIKDTPDGDNWGEPEKEETVEFDVVDLKRFDEGIKVELKPKEGFTSLWNKVRKNILGIKTPSERFEENMKKFDKNLRDAMRAHLNSDLVKDDKKTLNDLRKEHGFEDTVAREATDDEPVSLRAMAQPLLDELRYAWNKYIDDFEARWNHDMLKAHLNEKLVSDNVDSPNHYKLRGLDIEAIDVIRGALTEDEFRGFCKGNVLKYTIREGHKNGDEDLKKAKKYLEFLEEDDSDE